MYKQISSQYFENQTGSTHRFVEDALQHCLDVINYEKGTIVGSPLMESFHDASYGRYGSVTVIYMVDAKNDDVPSNENKKAFIDTLNNAFK